MSWNGSLDWRGGRWNNGGTRIRCKMIRRDKRQQARMLRILSLKIVGAVVICLCGFVCMVCCGRLDNIDCHNVVLLQTCILVWNSFECEGRAKGNFKPTLHEEELYQNWEMLVVIQDCYSKLHSMEFFWNEKGWQRVFFNLLYILHEQEFHQTQERWVNAKINLWHNQQNVLKATTTQQLTHHTSSSSHKIDFILPTSGQPSWWSGGTRGRRKGIDVGLLSIELTVTVVAELACRARSRNKNDPN